MGTALIPFAYEDQLVRSVLRADDPWFIAKDVATILGYRNATDMVRMLDDDEKGTHNLRTLGGDQNLIIINESGLYCAILRSRRPEAKRFRKWVTGEVLPSLRRTGSYALPGSVVAAQRDRADALERLVRFDRENVPLPLASSIATMPVWSNGRRPKFWPDIEVRALLTALHRQVQLEQAVARCVAEFGAERSPSRSALSRYWLVLDKVRGIGPARRPASKH